MNVYDHTEVVAVFRAKIKLTQLNWRRKDTMRKMSKRPTPLPACQRPQCLSLSPCAPGREIGDPVFIRRLMAVSTHIASQSKPKSMHIFDLFHFFFIFLRFVNEGHHHFPQLVLLVGRHSRVFVFAVLTE